MYMCRIDFVDIWCEVWWLQVTVIMVFRGAGLNCKSTDFPLQMATMCLSDYKKTVLDKNLKCIHSHCYHVINILKKCCQNHIPPALLKCVHVWCASILTKITTFSAPMCAMWKKMAKNHSANYTLPNMCHFISTTFYHRTCWYAWFSALGSHEKGSQI